MILAGISGRGGGRGRDVWVVKWEEGEEGEMCVKLSGRKGRGRDVCAVKWEEGGGGEMCVQLSGRRGVGERCVCS